MQKSTESTRRELTTMEIIAIFSTALVRTGFYGFRFYPVIDDWIQYRVYNLFPNLWHDVFINIGLFTYRPLAGLADLYVWNHVPAFFIITLMHAGAILLFMMSARRLKIPLGMGFAAILLFLPINAEATLWLSASTRLIVPTFFTALALHFLTGNRRGNLYFFWIFQLISLGFYEQIAIISCFLCFIAGYKTKQTQKMAITVMNFVTVIAYYSIAKGHGSLGDRVSVTTPDMLRIRTMLSQIGQGWGIVQLQLLSNGFLRGLWVLAQRWWYILPILLAAVIFGIAANAELSGQKIVLNNALFYLYKDKTDRKNRRFYTKIILGIILFLIPYIPFVFFHTPHIGMRNLFPSLIGLGLIVDALISGFRHLRAALIIYAIVCMVITCSELHDYKAASEADATIAHQLAQDIQSPDFVLQTVPSVIQTNVQFQEHIINITNSDWLATGAVRAVSKDVCVPMIEVDESLKMFHVKHFYAPVSSRSFWEFPSASNDEKP